ncbi:MAG: hypothetical protein JW759_06995 [Candidatus Coatesbacteria bacterium]|nr:hypothetical protein [Candidatus Coatesbacteria bacterium]
MGTELARLLRDNMSVSQDKDAEKLPKALILLTSDVDHLREAIGAVVRLVPDVSLTLCAQKDIARGLEGLAGVQRIITARRVGSISFALSRSFVKELRTERYALCVLLQRQRGARVGLRAIALACLARASRRLAHVPKVGFVPFSRAMLASMSPFYLLFRPTVFVDRSLATVIRKAADLIVRLMLFMDRRRGRGLR